MNKFKKIRELAEALQYQWDMAYPSDAPHDLDEAWPMAARAVKLGTYKSLLKLCNEWIEDNEPVVPKTEDDPSEEFE